MSQLADFTNFVKATTGEIPPPLVGASTTVIGSKLYIFAGRLVASREMTCDIYVLDLATLIWKKLGDATSTAPRPRYFHSANAYKGWMIIFGGMCTVPTTQPRAQQTEPLNVLDDIGVFDTSTGKWITPTILHSELTPKPRYAHLGATSANKLVIAGGQDIRNVYLEDVHYLDLKTMTWIARFSLDKHCGAYRSVAVSSPYTIMSRPPADSDREKRRANSTDVVSSRTQSPKPVKSRRSSTSNALGQRRLLEAAAANQADRNKPNLKKRLDVRFYEAKLAATKQVANPIYLYSNYNFTEVRRELYTMQPTTENGYEITDKSSRMAGSTLPPGLRFPNGAVFGNSMIISGTYLTNSSQTFSIWSLDLTSYEWTRIDVGGAFSEGSWNRGILSHEQSKYIVLGNKSRNLVDDYNHRQTNFDHVTIVDLEAFSIYRPVVPTMSPLAVELGLLYMRDPTYSDMEILTGDYTLIPCSSRMLATKWPGYINLMNSSTPQNPISPSRQSSSRPSVSTTIVTRVSASQPHLQRSSKHISVPIPERPRVLHIPHPHSIVSAFVRYLYTGTLDTSIEASPYLLSSLLLLVRTLNPQQLSGLAALCVHGLHRCLSINTAALVYETASLSCQHGLQIRALKSMVVAKKKMQAGTIAASAPAVATAETPQVGALANLEKSEPATRTVSSITPVPQISVPPSLLVPRTSSASQGNPTEPQNPATVPQTSTTTTVTVTASTLHDVPLQTPQTQSQIYQSTNVIFGRTGPMPGSKLAGPVTLPSDENGVSTN